MLFVQVNASEKFAFPWMESFPSYKIYESAEQELILQMDYKSELESFENVSPSVTRTFQYIWLVVTHSKFTTCKNFGQKNKLFPCSDRGALKFVLTRKCLFTTTLSLYRVSHSLPNPAFL